MHGDTPSPVDLSMPPPAPPMQQSDSNSTASSSGTTMSTTVIQNFTPVTPASIMNLGRLGTNSSLAPPSQNAISCKADGKSKSSSSRSRERPSAMQLPKKAVGNPLISPSLKPILPGTCFRRLSSLVLIPTFSPAGNVGVNTMASVTSPILRKTSHKAAEQKRRDSLKTTFDDLRTLLPPIPLPSEEGFPDEPILPGAMPPRGPPRGNVDGPNRSISKLQLLRCGNDYIRLLKGQIERRNVEMATLRTEVERLRGLIPEDVWGVGAELIDLEKDLDIGEIGPWKGNGSACDGDEGEEE
ncbi:hypothetical protein EW146_g3288 [Bondarzewia mesenterica]|uniref:BHLH domain-containing protein n=1 Tax=Bondarzewia mesenterica TaxID=1095465 RepID=A0A4S4M0A7_9AGAM|nr:hypothetical protein EW146_g3288 [Bondarzewia mesenterica]